MMAFVYTATSLALLAHSIAAASAPPIPTDDGRRILQTAPDDGDLRFHEATFIASHNAHASLALSGGNVLLPLGTNQEGTIFEQLADDGVRGLLIDVMIDNDKDEPLRLTHSSGFLTLDYGGARSELGSNLIPFLEGNENAIVSLFLEVDGDSGGGGAAIRTAIMDHLREILSSMTVKGQSLKDMTFKYDDGRWRDHEDWPKLEEIRASGQRLFIFMDRSDMADAEYGFMYNRQVMQENDWQGIDICENRYAWGAGKVSLPSNNRWTRLFFMNHFPGGTGPDSRVDTVGENLIGGGVNGWGILYRRILECMSSNGGFKPNYIALDWVVESKEAREILNYLNLGGRIGTGQACTDDSHCATSSCDIDDGICQCQQCPLNTVDVCLGCETGEYCTTVGGNMNMCKQKNAGTISGSTKPPFDNANSFYCGSNYTDATDNCYVRTPCPTGAPGVCPGGGTCYGGVTCIAPPTISPTSSTAPTTGASSPRPFVSPSSADPTVSPVESGLVNVEDITLSPTGEKLEASFYCGIDYEAAARGCGEAVKCPGGQEECPEDEVCYFLTGVVCPTPPPSLKPSESPSTMSSSVSISSPILGETVVSPPTLTRTSLCGTDFLETSVNCRSAVPCTRRSDCAYLGIEFTCFSVICGDPPVVAVDKPLSTETTPPPSGRLFGNLGLTKEPTPGPTFGPTTRIPTATPTSTPSSRPTKAPFDFSNLAYCGANYTDAEENCYNVNTPCPTGAPETCPDGHSCYAGIMCNAPPTTSPTTSPTKGPTKSPQVSPSDPSSPGGTPVGSTAGGGMPGERLNNIPAEGVQFATRAPYDVVWGNASGATVQYTLKIVWSVAFAFGVAGLQF